MLSRLCKLRLATCVATRSAGRAKKTVYPSITGRSTPSRAGFSLLEVLIAFAVMAAVLGALLPGQAAMAARTGEAAERLLAADYALSRLDALGVAEPVLASAETTYRDWRIAIASEPAILPAPPDWPLQRITVTVRTAGGTVLAEVSTLRAAD